MKMNKIPIKSKNINEAYLSEDGKILKIPKRADDWTKKGHISGLNIKRQHIIKENTILEKLKNIDHPNIMKIYDYDDEWVYVEYIKGMILSNRNSFSPKTKCYLDEKNAKIDIKKIFETLSFLHNIEISWTDLTGFNIMVDENGNFKFIDLICCMPLTKKLKCWDYLCMKNLIKELKDNFKDKLIINDDYDFKNQNLGENHYQPFIKNSLFWLFPDEIFFHGKYERNCIERLYSIKKFIEINNDNCKTLLDIGCNIGLFTFFFQNTGLNCKGIDNSVHVKVKKFTDKSSIEVANYLKNIYNSYPTFLDGDYVEEIQKNCSDITLFLSVFHHHFKGYGDDKTKQKLTIDQCERILKNVFNATNKILIFEYDHKITPKPFNDINYTINLFKKYGCKSISIINHEKKKSKVNNYVFDRYLLGIVKR